MKKITFVLFCCFLFIIAKGQEFNSTNSMLENFRLSMLPSIRDLESSELSEKYDGSPFLNEEWKEGTVTLNTGKSHKFLIKYLVYGDLILIKNEKDSINKLNLSNQILHIKFNDHTFIYISYPWHNKIKEGLMEVLYDNKSKLLKLYTCRIEKGAETSGYQEKEKDKFLIKEVLYCQISDGKLMLLPRSKKELFQLFGDKNDQVERFFKEQKLKIKNEKDIAKIFTYYDMLK